MGDWYMCKVTIDMEAYIGIVQRHTVCCHQDDVFHRKSMVIRSRQCHSACATTAWFHRHRVNVLVQARSDSY